MKQMLLKYARYNQWANARTLSLVNKETSAYLDKEISSSFNSIRKTLLHIADAEYIWYGRLAELPLEHILSGLPSKSGSAIESLAEYDQKLIALIEAKEENYFDLSTAYKSLKGEPFNNKNSSILWQVFNHATFHRGQVVTMIRLGGFTGSIESTDFIAFERLV